jgi:DnaK suppressor protein
MDRQLSLPTSHQPNPSSMPLTSAQRKLLEKTLKEERERALRILNRGIDDSAGASDRDRDGDLSSLPLHPADRGTDTMQEELEAANATRVSNELAEIDAALDRLYRDPESFGKCEDTGADIPLERLKIIPWARTCRQAEAES